MERNLTMTCPELHGFLVLPEQLLLLCQQKVHHLFGVTETFANISKRA